MTEQVRVWHDEWRIGDGRRYFRIGDHVQWVVEAPATEFRDAFALIFDPALANSLDWLEASAGDGGRLFGLRGVVIGLTAGYVRYEETWGGSPLAGSGTLRPADRAHTVEHLDDLTRPTLHGFLAEVTLDQQPVFLDPRR